MGHSKNEQQAESLAGVSLLICSQLKVRRSTWKLQDAVTFKSRATAGYRWGVIMG